MSNNTEEKKRSANFSGEEVLILLEELALRKESVLSKKTTSVQKRMKVEGWQCIADRINDYNGSRSILSAKTTRTVEQLRKKWRDMKTIVQTFRKKLLKGDSDGPLPLKPQYYEQILSIVGEDSLFLPESEDKSSLKEIDLQPLLNESTPTDAKIALCNQVNALITEMNSKKSARFRQSDRSIVKTEPQEDNVFNNVNNVFDPIEIDASEITERVGKQTESDVNINQSNDRLSFEPGSPRSIPSDASSMSPLKEDMFSSRKRPPNYVVPHPSIKSTKRDTGNQGNGDFFLITQLNEHSKTNTDNIGKLVNCLNKSERTKPESKYQSKSQCINTTDNSNDVFIFLSQRTSGFSQATKDWLEDEVLKLFLEAKCKERAINEMNSGVSNHIRTANGNNDSAFSNLSSQTLQSDKG